jgi:hypothetical protein
MSHIFVLFVSQKFVANQIGLLQTHYGNFASKFVIKFVAKMRWWKRTLSNKGQITQATLVLTISSME